jgi:hypothetical protein
MNRRSFFKLSAAATVAAAAPLRAVQVQSEQSQEDWWSTVEEKLTHEARSEDGSLQLRVRLITPEDVTPRTSRNGDDEVTRYELQGELLPADFYPGRNILRMFGFSWDGRAMPIPERFWKDLSGFEIRTSTLDLSTVSIKERFSAEEFLADLRQPRLTLSADGGTALIEWQRSEECDSQSTIRWLISRSGTILRHRAGGGCRC